MLSQTVEYALRAMVFLTANADGATSAQVIAQQIRVPERYMSKVMRNLVVAGLVHSRRGPTGGFALARPASQISMLAVIEAVEPMPRISKCPLNNPRHAALCPMHRRLEDAYQLIRDVLGRSSLEEVAGESASDSSCSILSSAPSRVLTESAASQVLTNGSAHAGGHDHDHHHEHDPDHGNDRSGGGCGSHSCDGNGRCGGSRECGDSADHD